MHFFLAKKALRIYQNSGLNHADHFLRFCWRFLKVSESLLCCLTFLGILWGWWFRISLWFFSCIENGKTPSEFSNCSLKCCICWWAKKKLSPSLLHLNHSSHLTGKSRVLDMKLLESRWPSLKKKHGHSRKICRIFPKRSSKKKQGFFFQGPL